MKNYFVYELKKSLFGTGCIALVATVIYIIQIFANPLKILAENPYTTYLALMSQIGMFIAAAVPVWMFAYRTKRRSVDLYYSLPLSHKKILLVKFFTGLIVVFTSYTIAYWLGAFTVMSLVFEKLNAVYYVVQYSASIIPLYFIYAMASFVFTRANRIIDGIFFIVFWALAAILLAETLDQLVRYVTKEPYELIDGSIHYRIISHNDGYIFSNYFLPFAPLNVSTNHFSQHLIAGYEVLHGDFKPNEMTNLIVGFTLTGLQAIGATAGLFLLERKTKGENAGQISESLFGYKVMIPFFTVILLGCTLFISIISYIYVILILVGAYFISALYRHSLWIGKKQAVIFVISVAAGIILGFLCAI